jgi:hypothetical protein
MKRVQLITECSWDTQLVESKDKKDMFIVGIFSTAELKNANGRIYKKDLLEREVSKLQESLSKGMALWGNLGHPTGPETDLDKVAIRTTELQWRGNDLYGKAKIVDTPNGNILKALVKEGPVGVSSRGLGTVDESSSYVNDDLQILCWDAVSSPSNYPSYVKGIYEGKTFEIYSEEDANQEIQLKEQQEAYFKKVWQVLTQI